MTTPLLYLPSEGLQGEDIPSYAIWEDMDIESVTVSFRSPLVFKDVYNAHSWEVQDDRLVVGGVELDGYLGLLFGSRKVSAIVDDVPFEYSFHLSNGEVVRRAKKIRLFRPKLEVEESDRAITVDLGRRFVRNRIRAKNVGRGTLMMSISTAEESPAKLETPPEYKDFIERFEADMSMELSLLAKEFPQYEPLIFETLEWDERVKGLGKFAEGEREKFADYTDKLLKTIANNKEFQRGLLGAFAKALVRNVELIESIGRFIQFYESVVSRNILLVNPFDEIDLREDEQEMILEVRQTDRILDEYDDLKLVRTIKLEGSEMGKIPVHRLFEWG